jgi:hypothetical protein
MSKQNLYNSRRNDLIVPQATSRRGLSCDCEQGVRMNFPQLPVPGVHHHIVTHSLSSCPVALATVLCLPDTKPQHTYTKRLRRNHVLRVLLNIPNIGLSNVSNDNCFHPVVRMRPHLLWRLRRDRQSLPLFHLCTESILTCFRLFRFSRGRMPFLSLVAWLAKRL